MRTITVGQDTPVFALDLESGTCVEWGYVEAGMPLQIRGDRQWLLCDGENDRVVLLELGPEGSPDGDAEAQEGGKAPLLFVFASQVGVDKERLFH